jgi:hypothetical protein
MTKSKKRLEKMRQNPLSVRFEDLLTVLDDYGYDVREASGSHYFARIEIEGKVWKTTLVRPHGKKNTVDPRSIKLLLNQFEEIDEWREELAKKEEDDE